jgi:uncharacterized protein DUF4440
MKISRAVGIAALCVSLWTVTRVSATAPSEDDQTLLEMDRAAFGFAGAAGTLQAKFLDDNFTWTDSSGRTRSKSEIDRDLQSGKKLPLEAPGGSEDGKGAASAIRAHTYGTVGIVQASSGNLHVLRVWVKREAGWQLLVYQAVAIGAPPAFEQGNGTCENPCRKVPFRPRTQDELEVIAAYQAVERAVAAHDSAAWGAHIAEEFFAVTSNSDRPLDRKTRMAGLDNQKVAGIAPFPLVSARMFQFGDAMVMISTQQPERGLPLHVTRVWFMRGGAWLEAYSYQTTIQSASQIDR